MRLRNANIDEHCTNLCVGCLYRESVFSRLQNREHLEVRLCSDLKDMQAAPLFRHIDARQGERFFCENFIHNNSIE